MQRFLSIENVKQLPLGNYDVRDAPGTSRRQQAAISGFVLRMRATGRHAYFLNFARGRWIKLGDASKLTADQARELAKNFGGRVASGADPVEERREARREAVAGTTLRDFVTRIYRPWAVAHLRGAVEALRKLDAIAVTELGDLALDAITPFAVERWRTRRLKAKHRDKRISPNTVNRELADLKAAIAKAVAWKHLSADPLSVVKLSKIDRVGVVRFLEPEEERRLRAALTARDDVHRAGRERYNTWRRERQYDELPQVGTYADGLTPIVLVAMNTGLRFGELANMRWRDVDQRRAMLTVVGTGTKSQQTRYVPLNTEALDVLRRWGGRSPDPEAYVFPGRDGARLVDVKTAWRDVLEAAGITRFRFHDLRHHFASRLVQSGVDLNTVRELLGHGDLKMTLRYAHLAPEHKAAAVAKLVSA